jgi:non-ribosomal peptide synthase protein (TIGR01720 family)
LGYGLLRYLRGDEELSRSLASLPQAQVSFNYLGRIEGAQGGAGAMGGSTEPIFDWAEESAGASNSPRAHRAHLIDVNAQISGQRLQIELGYSDGAHRRTTIEKLAEDYRDALVGIIDHCRTPEAGGHTPSDFPDVRLDQQTLDRLMSKVSQASRGPGRRA